MRRGRPRLTPAIRVSLLNQPTRELIQLGKALRKAHDLLW
jgi:hypothetical protein